MSDVKENTVNPATEEPVQAAEGAMEEVRAAEPATAEPVEGALVGDAHVEYASEEDAAPEAPAEKSADGPASS